MTRSVEGRSLISPLHPLKSSELAKALRSLRLDPKSTTAASNATVPLRVPKGPQFIRIRWGRNQRRSPRTVDESVDYVESRPRAIGRGVQDGAKRLGNTTLAANHTTAIAVCRLELNKLATGRDFKHRLTYNEDRTRYREASPSKNTRGEN